MLIPRNNSEGDVESKGDFLEYENLVLKKVTYGVVILNSNYCKKDFLELVRKLYKKHIDHLA